MATHAYLRALALWSLLLGSALFAYRSLTTLFGPGFPTGASRFPAILGGFIGDLGIVLTLSALLGGLAYGRASIGRSESSLPHLMLLAAGSGFLALILNGVAAPSIEKAISVAYYEQPESAFPTGALTPWALLELRAGALDGSIPVPDPNVTASAAASLYLIAAFLPFALGILTALNTLLGCGIANAARSRLVGSGAWLFSLLTTGALLAGSALAIPLARADAVPPLILLLTPFAIPLSASAVLLWILLGLSQSSG